MQSWFTLAAKSGNADSKLALESLTQIMTESQLRDAQARVSDWVSHHNSVELLAHGAEVKKLDSYATAGQP